MEDPSGGAPSELRFTNLPPPKGRGNGYQRTTNSQAKAFRRVEKIPKEDKKKKKTRLLWPIKDLAQVFHGGGAE